VVGAIGPQLGLSLLQSIVIMVVGQAAGTLIFGAFTLMGKRTAVSQFALGRMAFGRRGNNIPSTTSGYSSYSVAAVIMIIQLTIGTLGYYTIRTFEKWTAPVLAAVMAVMTVLAFKQGKRCLEPLDGSRSRADHGRQRADDRGRDRVGILVVSLGV
jgi:NCS1 family nucleobase:cation symporter-1